MKSNNGVIREYSESNKGAIKPSNDNGLNHVRESNLGVIRDEYESIKSNIIEYREEKSIDDETIEEKLPDYNSDDLKEIVSILTSNISLVVSPAALSEVKEQLQVYGKQYTRLAIKKAIRQFKSNGNKISDVRLTRYARGILKDWAVHGCSEQELKPVSIQIKPFNKSKSQTYVKKDDIAVNSLRQFMEVGDE